MTIYKANWIEAPRGEYETRTAFDANLVGPTTDSLAAVSIERIDANIYDHLKTDAGCDRRHNSFLIREASYFP